MLVESTYDYTYMHRPCLRINRATDNTRPDWLYTRKLLPYDSVAIPQTSMEDIIETFQFHEDVDEGY